MDHVATSHALVLVTADAELLDNVLSVTAAVGIEPQLASDPGALRPCWSTAAAVLVGVDQAAEVAAMVLPRRAEIYVLGLERDRDAVHAWSAPLGAAVITLPDGAGRLAAALADADGQRSGDGQAVCVVGGSGGVRGLDLCGGPGIHRGSARRPDHAGGRGSPRRWHRPAGGCRTDSPAGVGRGWPRPEAISATSAASFRESTGSTCCRWPVPSPAPRVQTLSRWSRCCGRRPGVTG